MKKIIIFTAIAVLIAGLTTLAMAQRGAGMNAQKGGNWFQSDDGRGMGGCGGLLACKDSLGLSDAQVTKIKEINFAHQNAMIDLRASLQKAELKIRQLRQSDAGKTEMLAASKEITTIKGKMAEARINHMFDLKGVLNKDQLEKWQNCRMGCCGPDMDMGGPRMGRPGGHRGMDRFNGHGMGNPNAPHDPDNCPMRGDGPRDGSGMQDN